MKTGFGNTKGNTSCIFAKKNCANDLILWAFRTPPMYTKCKMFYDFNFLLHK